MRFLPNICMHTLNPLIVAWGQILGKSRTACDLYTHLLNHPLSCSSTIHNTYLSIAPSAGAPVAGSHSLISPLRSPEANTFPSGLQAVQST